MSLPPTPPPPTFADEDHPSDFAASQFKPYGGNYTHLVVITVDDGHTEWKHTYAATRDFSDTTYLYDSNNLYIGTVNGTYIDSQLKKTLFNKYQIHPSYPYIHGYPTVLTL